MKMSLEFKKLKDKKPENYEQILIACRIDGIVSGQVVHKNVAINMLNEDFLYWTYFDFQPERSKREDSRKCEMRCSEHCSNAVRDK